MADVKISALLDLGTAPAANDYVPIVDASAAATKRVTIADLFTNPDVTGTVTADGLTVDVSSGSAQIIDSGTTAADTPQLLLGNGDTSARSGLIRNYNDTTSFDIIASASTTADKPLKIKTKDASGDRVLVAANGDISFFEDTGTTAKFFWDASAERLGLGTTAPATDIHVSNSSADAILKLAGQTGARIQLSEADVVDKDWHIVANSGNFIVNETTDAGGFVASPLVIEGGAGNGAMYLKSGGYVGIGTTSPSFALDVDAVSAEFAARFTGTTTGYIRVNNDTGYADLGSTGNNMLMRTGGVERARIDSSGNLLINRPSSFSSAKVEVQSAGTSGTGASQCLMLNNTGADGAVLEIAKSGTTVGSIGSNSGYLYIGQGDTTLAFSAGADLIFPRGTDGASRDAAIDLGNGSNRFKDLYLSGGVYLGGIGGANLLDDYEEGTFTPTVAGDATGVLGTAQGYYTKVGRLVNVSVYITISTNFTSSAIGGLPFTVAAGHTATGYDTVTSVMTQANDFIQATAQSSTTNIIFINDGDATSSHSPNTTNSAYRVSFSYIAA